MKKDKKIGKPKKFGRPYKLVKQNKNSAILKDPPKYLLKVPTVTPDSNIREPSTFLFQLISRCMFLIIVI